LLPGLTRRIGSTGQPARARSGRHARRGRAHRRAGSANRALARIDGADRLPLRDALVVDPV